MRFFLLTLLVTGLSACNAPKKAVGGGISAKSQSSNADQGKKSNKGKPKAERDARKVKLKAAKVLTADEAIALAAKDAEANKADGVVYISLAHIAEGGNADELEPYRFGVAKMLNSLSIRPEMGVMEPLDDAESVFRVVLSDFSLTQNDWNTIATEAHSGDHIVKSGAATVAQGDWFVFAASRPDIYNKVLRLPPAIAGMEAQLNLDSSESPVVVEVIKSEVTFNPRTLERYSIDIGGAEGGYYWRSYDKLFGLVAGEFFYSLPNGLQAYMLSGFIEQMRDDARADVATDKNRDDGLTRCVGGVPHCGYVINGESCLTCHASGININKNIDNAKTTDAARLEEVMASDATRFADALGVLGYEIGPEEPILTTIKFFKSANGVADRRSVGGEVPSNITGGGILSR